MPVNNVLTPFLSPWLAPTTVVSGTKKTRHDVPKDKLHKGLRIVKLYLKKQGTKRRKFLKLAENSKQKVMSHDPLLESQRRISETREKYHNFFYSNKPISQITMIFISQFHSSYMPFSQFHSSICPKSQFTVIFKSQFHSSQYFLSQYHNLFGPKSQITNRCPPPDIYLQHKYDILWEQLIVCKHDF